MNIQMNGASSFLEDLASKGSLQVQLNFPFTSSLHSIHLDLSATAVPLRIDELFLRFDMVSSKRFFHFILTLFILLLVQSALNVHAYLAYCIQQSATLY